jgi:hypothetical protein
MASIDESPLPSAGDRVAVNRSVAASWRSRRRCTPRATGQRSSGHSRTLPSGDGAGLLQLHDAYYGRRADGTYGNLIEAFQAINCADDEERPTIEEADADADAVLGGCAADLPAHHRVVLVHLLPTGARSRASTSPVAGAGPIVVVGTTGDPATPLESSRAMADTLEDGRLVIVDANEHTGYRGDDCVRAHRPRVPAHARRTSRRHDLLVAGTMSAGR